MLLKDLLDGIVDLSSISNTIDTDMDISSVSSDSREVRPGSIFVAIKGTRTDGADFIKQAVEKGARLVITHRSSGLDIPQIIVPSPQDIYARLLWRFYGVDKLLENGRLRLYGITGTNGKTTISYLIQYLLSALGIKCARFGTVEYDLLKEKFSAVYTTPEPRLLAELIVKAYNNGAEAIVLEVSSHSLDQARLSGLKLSVGCFSNLTGDHLDYHETMENYLNAKLKIIDLMGKNGRFVVNIDDPAAPEFMRKASLRNLDILSCSLKDKTADLFADNIIFRAGSAEFDLNVGAKRCFSFKARVPYIGLHNVCNVLLAIASVLQDSYREKASSDLLGDLRDTIRHVIKALESAPAIPGRLERIDNKGGFDVYIDYAHTDDGLKNVLSALRPLTSGRLIVVFGCGGDRDRLKRPRMAAVAEELSDYAIITSDNPRTEDPYRIVDDILKGFSVSWRKKHVIVELDRKEAIRKALSMARRGDVILIAGKGHEDYQIIGQNRFPFSDRLCTIELLREMGYA